MSRNKREGRYRGFGYGKHVRNIYSGMVKSDHARLELRHRVKRKTKSGWVVREPNLFDGATIQADVHRALEQGIELLNQKMAQQRKIESLLFAKP